MTPQRLWLLFIAVAIHLVALVMLARATNTYVKAQTDDAMTVMIFNQPKIRERGTVKRSPDLSRLLMRVNAPMPSLNIDLPQIDFEVSRNESARSTAPSLKNNGQADMRPYLRQAALLQGEGATVVLRIEVLDNGEPGRIAVDVSSGSAQIDQAAVDYARTQHWYAGRMNGVARVRWIRWGVRLQA